MMSICDPIANLYNCICIGQKIQKRYIELFSSKKIISILSVLKIEGYILNYEVCVLHGNKLIVRVYLKYVNNIPVISSLKCVSKQSVRVYCKTKHLPVVLNGLGIGIISTSQGVMSTVKARQLGLGGEIFGIVE